MGTINKQFFEDLESKATWSAGVAFKRSNSLPLDKYSVFESVAAAEAYATSNAVAYPGQVIAAYDETAKEMLVYVLAETETGTTTDETSGEKVTTYGLTLQEIGGKIDLDGTSLAFNDETGLLEISGFKKAATATLPQKKVDEKGNESIEWVTIDAIVEGDGNTTYTITPLKKNVGTEEAPIEEIYGFTLTPSEGAATEIALDVYTKTEIDKAFANVYTKTETDSAIDSAVKGILGEDVSEAYDTLVEIQKLMEADDTASAELIGKVNKNTEDIATLNGDATVEGSVAHAIAAENLGQYAKAQEVANTYVTKAVATADNGVRFINQDEIDILGNLNLGDDGKVEISGQVNSNNVLGLYDKVTSIITGTNADLDLDPNTDGVQAGLGIAAGAQVNKIEKIVFNGAEASIENKVATIAGEYYTKSEVDTKVKTATDAAATAQTTADNAKTAAETNASNIKALQETTIPAVKAIADKNTEDIAALTTKVSIEEGKLGTLETAVNSKAEASTVSALAERVGTNEGNVTNLTSRVGANETAIAGLGESKADKTSVYTKTEIGTITEGKTLVQMIAEAQSAATYDDTQVKADIATNVGNISKNTEAIAVLNGESDAGKSVRAIAVEEIAKVVASAPEDFDTLKEIADWIQSDTTGAASMSSDIEDLKDIVNGIGGTDEEPTVIAYVAKAIAAAAPGIATAEIAGLVKSSSAENAIAVNAETGVMTVNKINVNNLTQTEGDVLVLNGGTASKNI